jgi:Flp pilus assembly protein TadG
MVEFALVAMVLLTLLFGIFELGRTIWSYNTIAYAARQASRYASVRSNLGDSDYSVTPNPIDTVVYTNAPGLDPSALIITKTWTPDNSRGSRVEITVTYPINLIASPIFAAGRGSFNVSATSVLTVLN